MIYCRIFKITFPNEFSKESFDSYILTNHTKVLEKKLFLMRITVTTSQNVGFYLNFFDSKNDLDNAWKEKGRLCFLKLNHWAQKLKNMKVMSLF